MVMKDEYNALIKNKMWDLVPRSSNANIIWSLWIFRHKNNSDRSFKQYKALLVRNGVNQQTSVDYGETFNTVVKPATINTILSIALWKLFLEKCTFMVKVDKLLRLYLTKRVIESNPYKFDTIIKVETPSTKERIMKMYKMISTFNRFISWFSQHKLSFYKLIRKELKY